MSTLSFSGLSSGLDTNAIIDAVMASERVPITAIQNKQNTLNSALTTVNSLTSKLGTLKTSAQALSSALGFSSFKASSSDAAVVANVTGAPSAGTFNVSVTQLAREQRSYSAAQASSTAALNLSGSLTLQVGAGSTASVNVLATDTLTDIAAKINSSGQRIGASILYDGSQYKLQVRGLDSGQANTITFGGTMATDLGLTGTPYQSAQDAILTVDNNQITRSTNQIVGVIPGVTLALTKTTSSAASVSVQSDPDTLKSKIQTFVTAYNDVVGASQTAAGWGQIKAGNTALAGDSAIRSVMSRLSASIGNNVPGTSGKYTTLASIGLASNKDGKLVLDDTKMRAAIEADPTAVQKLFINDTLMGSTGAMTGVMSTVDQLANNSGSLLKAKSESLSAQVKRMDDDVAAIQRRMDQLQAQMVQRFAALEQVVSQYKTQGNALASVLASST